ncbi:hypothetical protein [Desulfogranum japonicum]|uniref:hypothetical protein n=1 Tax=Desulfogranum japonicum TaxID=231447 RepID=UPI00048E7D09|nr:hypothetical protein [Desulfogranum japonicum]
MSKAQWTTRHRILISISLMGLALFNAGANSLAGEIHSKLSEDKAASAYTMHGLPELTINLSQFGPDFLEGDSPEQSRSSIQAILEGIKEVEAEYLDQLQSHRSSYGLYAAGEYDYDSMHAEDRYLAGVRWKLLNNGYYETIREDAKKILQTQLEFYQLRRDMLDRQLADEMYRIFTLENHIELHYHSERAQLLKEILLAREQQLAHGYVTRDDVIDIERKLTKARRRTAFYQQSDHVGFSKPERELCNKLEAVRLRPTDDLASLAQIHSHDLAIQDIFNKRADFLPAWLDDASLNLHAEYKDEFYERERSVVGIELEIPLTWDLKRSTLIQTQKRVYGYQKQAINHRIRQRLEKLSSLYAFHQERLTEQQDDLHFLLYQLKKTQTKQEHVIQNLDTDPARELNLLKLDLLDTQTEAHKTRLKLYQIIQESMAITQAESVTDLFALD